MNELILFIESAGMAWWAGLVVLVVAALAFLVIDRPSVPFAARKQKSEQERKVA